MEVAIKYVGVHIMLYLIPYVIGLKCHPNNKYHEFYFYAISYYSTYEKMHDFGYLVVYL